MSSFAVMLPRIIFGALMLVTGTWNTINANIQNNTLAPGLQPFLHKFQHPWVQTWFMFLGEALCFLGYLVVRWRAIRKKALWVGEVNLSKSHKLPAGLTEEDIQVAEAPLFDWVLPLPAMLDLIGSSLSGVGLLFIPPSVWQMLRGSLIVFSAILSVIFLKRKLVLLHWIGIALVVVGLGTVGTSSLLNSAGSADSSLWFGIGIVMVGQLVSSIQLIVEEILLKNRSLHPLHVVGLEGVSGILMLSTLVLPIMYYIPGNDAGSYENFLDAFAQIFQSGILIFLLFSYSLSISLFNFASLSIAKSLSTIHRTLIDSSRVVLIWVVSIIIYYAGAPDYGEAWQKFSWLQLIGFVVLLTGTGLYNFTKSPPPPGEEGTLPADQATEDAPLIQNGDNKYVPLEQN